MLKAITICGKCKKESAAYEDGDSILTFDFLSNKITFFCPKCGEESVMNFGDIKKALEQKLKLPSIGGARY